VTLFGDRFDAAGRLSFEFSDNYDFNPTRGMEGKLEDRDKPSLWLGGRLDGNPLDLEGLDALRTAGLAAKFTLHTRWAHSIVPQPPFTDMLREALRFARRQVDARLRRRLSTEPQPVVNAAAAFEWRQLWTGES